MVRYRDVGWVFRSVLHGETPDEALCVQIDNQAASHLLIRRLTANYIPFYTADVPLPAEPQAFVRLNPAVPGEVVLSITRG
ncbi:hypothetical protein AAGS40_26745 (plasmid) [Paraburkholderia sp. PREW-6R]|uniref:hypothetical protein n=1 Tax=Paraburkholderia sp. PREW-6R TaxID=3141544 RepID=UPI0031F4B0FE